MSAPFKRTILGLVCLTCAWLLSVAVVSAQRRNLDNVNCALTPDQILGQAYSGTAGAAGEIGDGGVTPEGEDIEAGGLAASSQWILDNLLYAAPGPEAVAVLVVDDFSSDGTGETPASHGWLVWEVFQQLHDLLPPDAASQISLQSVNIAGDAGYQSDLILPEIQAAIEELSAQGISRFVLNLSFVFIPCTDRDLQFNFPDFVQARRSSPERSLVEQVGGDPQAVQAILEDSRIGYIDETALAGTQQDSPRGSRRLLARQGQAGGTPALPPTPGSPQRAFRTQDARVLRLFNNARLSSDPLRAFLRQSRDLTIIPVASSGNFKQRQPFFPARWPEVISVSANEGNDLRFWLHSNNADVSVPGAWFSFEDGKYRAGTSFAAPVVSMLIAADLTQTAPTCAMRGNKPVLARGSYDNQLLLEAVGQYCR